jgi:hypothetical protein
MLMKVLIGKCLDLQHKYENQSKSIPFHLDIVQNFVYSDLKVDMISLINNTQVLDV